MNADVINNNTVPAEKMAGQAEKMTDIMAQFIGHTAVRLPDDVLTRLKELRELEEEPMASAIYDTMFRNLELARKLGRPSCQDTGVLQFHVICGTGFPLMGAVAGILREAVRRATDAVPLRPNCVETFEEVNTGDNTGKGVPTIWWDIVPEWDGCEIYTYMAGGGCSLPGHAMVLMPGEGYEGAAEFVLERMTSYGLNACPPLMVGVGLGNSVETAALNSKMALMRPVGSHNDDPKAAEMERILEESINAIGIGPQGVGGRNSVLGVNIVNTARHPATIGVAVNVACWSHRRGRIVFSSDIDYEVTTHSEFRYER